MKKLIALLAALTLLVAFAPACGKKKTATTEEDGGGKHAKKSKSAKTKETKTTDDSKEAKETKETRVDSDAPAVKGGTLYVIVDRNIKSDMSEKEVKNRNQTGEWMDADLTYMLKKAGHEPQIIENRSHRKGGNLLVVTITKYNPGNVAARAFVGYGAGSASMNVHYDLYGSGSSPILADDLGVGSSRDWRNVIRKIDEQVARAVSNKLGK